MSNRRVVHTGIVVTICESAPKWDPFSSPGKHLISERKLDRGGVRIGADRDPAGGGLSRLDQRLMLKSAGVPLRC